MIYEEELEEAELVEDTSDENNLGSKRKANENYISKAIFETKCEFDQLWKESELAKQFCIILWQDLVKKVMRRYLNVNVQGKQDLRNAKNK